MPRPAYGFVTYLMECAFTFASRDSRRSLYVALSVTPLIGLVTLTFDHLTSK